MRRFKVMIVLSLLAVLSLCALTACNTTTQDARLSNASDVAENNSAPSDELFKIELVGQSSTPGDEILGDPNRFYIYREVKTDVLYICFEEYRKGGLTVMLDPASGLPLTYTRYMTLYNTFGRKG